MIHAVIFDCFGVLVGQGFDETYRQAGGDPSEDKMFIHDLLLRANGGHITHEDFQSELCERLNITPKIWQAAVAKSELPNTELLDYVLKLKENYKTAVLSNVNTGVLHRKIPSKYLDTAFDVVVESAAVGFMKPQPEIYEHTAQQLGVEASHCVFTDDNTGFVDAAKDVGMQGIHFTDTASFTRQLEALLANSDS